MFRFLLITDERIKNVFVGNESAKVKPKEERDTTKSFNCLADLVCDHDLVVVLLGFLGHKNVAMPGALKEALMLREVAQKATWIVDKMDYPFGIGHHSYSEDVSDYIFSHFQCLDIERTGSSKTEGDDPQVLEEVSGFRTPIVVESEMDSELQVDSEDDDLADLLGPTVRKPKHKPYKYKRRPNGGGPGGGF